MSPVRRGRAGGSMRRARVGGWAGATISAGAGLVIGACAIAAIGAASAAPVGGGGDEDLRGLVAPYLEARARGTVGTVSGDASEDARSPASPGQPMAGVSVMLLPRWAAFDARLEEVRASARESTWSYAESGGRFGEVRGEYERALAMAGGGELVRGEVTDAQGRFRFEAVPAGSWIILAWHETSHVRGGRKLKPKDSGTFRGNLEHTGYVAVTVWRMDLDVRAGEPAAVSLNDRNAVFTGVRELRRMPMDAPPPTPHRRR